MMGLTYPILHPTTQIIAKDHKLNMPDLCIIDTPKCGPWMVMHMARAEQGWLALCW